MQKLEKRKTYTPTNASQVRGDRDLRLKKEETLSVANLKTFPNTPEVNLHQRTGGLKVRVCVVSIEGNQLMSCSAAKARKLVDSGKAKVFKPYPYTIQLNFKCENQVQDVTFGMDAGFNYVGFSAVTEAKELVCGTLVLDNKTSERLGERTMYRRGRRNKLWYREARFNNRGNKKEGWLPPSTERKYQAHLRLFKLYDGLLPIKKVKVEVANFDIQKILDAEISGVGYQQGDVYGFQNVRAYLFARENGTCQHCNKKIEKGQKAHVHHCDEHGEGGSNRASNLALLHEKCHIKFHKKGLKLSAPKRLKAETFMNIIQHRFEKDIPNVEIVFGYKTYVDRNKLGLEKTHFNDAFVIAGGTTQERVLPIEIKQKRRNNRAIQLNRKGFKPSIRKQRYKIQPKDLIWIDGKKHVASGVQNKGEYVKVEGSKKVYSIKKVEKIFNFGSFAFS